MVTPGFLENPEVRRWLNGVEPAWTMLEFDSFNALHDEPSASNQAIRLEPDLANAEISGSAVTANALSLLCQTARNRDPGSAWKRDPSRALGQACPGSEQEGPARVA
jgi:hypothetical protein